VDFLPTMQPKGRLLRWIIFWVLVAAGFFGGKWFMRFLYPLHYADTIKIEADRNGLDPMLVQAVVRVESRFNPSAKSSKGAIGLMQLMPETADWIAEKKGEHLPNTEELFKPEVNIRLGVSYLKDLLQEFDDSIPTALAAYNAGRGNVRRWLDVKVWDGKPETLNNIPFPETRSYLERIYADWDWYHKLYR
jgi:soluble lytic murein transglycosylase